MGLQPKTVTVVGNEERIVPIEQIRPGDIILVKPGERIAVDGIVTEGSSYVDESMLSGEPVAVSKQKDAKVFAGTINQKGSFRLQRKSAQIHCWQRLYTWCKTHKGAKHRYSNWSTR